MRAKPNEGEASCPSDGIAVGSSRHKNAASPKERGVLVQRKRGGADRRR